MAKKIALYENAEWQKDTPQSPGVDFTIPANTKNPQKHPSFSVTNQSDMENTDINKQFAKYEKTGMITDLISGEMRKPVYGDFTGLGNYYDLQTKLARVAELFDALPAPTRNKFENDPQKLIDFVADENNLPEMVGLGLLTREELAVLKPDDKIVETAPESAKPAPVQPANPAA